MKKEITCYLSHNYSPYHHFGPKPIQPHTFEIEDSHFASIEQLASEFEEIGFRKEAVKGMTVTNELAYLAIKMNNLFSLIDYKEDRKLTESDRAYYAEKGNRRGVEQFFRLNEILNSPTLGIIDFIDSRNGKESIESTALINFIRRAVLEKLDRSEREQSPDYLMFEYERGIYKANKQGKHIVGTLRNERASYAIDVFAFIMYELNLTVPYQMFKLGAGLCFYSGFPFFIGRGSKEGGVYDSWNIDLIKQFRNIVNTRPHRHHDDDRWCDIQFDLIDQLPTAKRADALEDFIKKLR